MDERVSQFGSPDMAIINYEVIRDLVDELTDYINMIYLSKVWNIQIIRFIECANSSFFGCPLIFLAWNFNQPKSISHKFDLGLVLYFKSYIAKRDFDNPKKNLL